MKWINKLEKCRSDNPINPYRIKSIKKDINRKNLVKTLEFNLQPKIGHIRPEV